MLLKIFIVSAKPFYSQIDMVPTYFSIFVILCYIVHCLVMGSGSTAQKNITKHINTRSLLALETNVIE